MTNVSTMLEKTHPSVAAEQVHSSPENSALEIRSLERVLSAIVRDSQSDPQTFLDETVVPCGGE